jgi:hypothetical protein
MGIIAMSNLATGKITNCKIKDCRVTGGSAVGGIVGLNNGKIINCYVVGGAITGPGDCIGGIVGTNNAAGTVEGCMVNASKAIASITGRWFVGGIAGLNLGKIETCHIYGAKIEASAQAGGIAGNNQKDVVGCTVNDAAAVIYGFDRAGGIVGFNNMPGLVEDCSVIKGLVTTGLSANTEIGGIVGRNANGALILACKNTGLTVDGNQSQTSVGGIVGLNSGIVAACNYYLRNNALNDLFSKGSTTASIGGIAGKNDTGGAKIISCVSLSQGGAIPGVLLYIQRGSIVGNANSGGSVQTCVGTASAAGNVVNASLDDYTVANQVTGATRTKLNDNLLSVTDKWEWYLGPNPDYAPIGTTAPWFSYIPK